MTSFIPANPGFQVVFVDREDDERGTPFIDIAPVVAWRVVQTKYFTCSTPITIGMGLSDDMRQAIICPNGRVEVVGDRPYRCLADWLLAVAQDLPEIGAGVEAAERWVVAAIDRLEFQAAQ